MRRRVFFWIILVVLPLLLQIQLIVHTHCISATARSDYQGDGIDNRRTWKCASFRIREYITVYGVDKIRLWPWDLEFIEDIISLTCERGDDFVTIQVGVRNNGVSPSSAAVEFGNVPWGIDPNLRQLGIGVDPNSSNNIPVEFRALDSCSLGLYIVEFHLVYHPNTPERAIIDTMQFHITVPGIPFASFSVCPIEALVIGFVLQGVLVVVVLRLESYIRKQKKPI